MGSLLIENVAIALGTDPRELDDLRLRKLCILIDWTLTLLTREETKKSYTPLFRKDIVVKDELTTRLANIIQKDGFAELDRPCPDSELMDNMFRRLGVKLGFSIDFIESIETGFISDYETCLANNGLVYTNFLSYKSKLSEHEQTALRDITRQLAGQFPNLRLNNLSFFAFDEREGTISINNLSDFGFNNLTGLEKALFLITLLNYLASFQKNFKRTISESSLVNIFNQLNNLQNTLPASKEIEQGLTEFIALNKRTPISDKLRQLLTCYLLRFPEFRGWKVFDHFSSQPIHRIILLGYQDIADDEIIRTVNLMYRKHPNENIAVTFNPEDVLQVANPCTLQVIGHGTIENETTINANLGPFRGNAHLTGRQVAELVNQNPNIQHLRLYSCFSGKLNNGNLHRLSELQRPSHHLSSEIRRKFYMLQEGNLTPDNSPFVDFSPAVSCWNAINKQGRAITMTVSPGIIEPEESLGCLVWKSTTYDEGFARGIKDIFVTTGRNPHYLPWLKTKNEPLPQEQDITAKLKAFDLTKVKTKHF